tara:strand:+ start:351 stop:620 length:270 start_codon:yes stop_codon:yes gene_type:complete
MSEFTDTLCKQVIDSKDNLIKIEVTRFLGSEWKVEDLKGMAGLLVMPDGSEIFTVDGVELIQFFKIESQVNANGISYTANVKQKYKILR